MEDKRSLYINHLLNHYRQKSVFDSIELYPVTYRYENADNPKCLYFRHNEGLDTVRDYIRDLEKKVDELQYIERIIKVAKENNYDKTPKRNIDDTHQRATHLFDRANEPLSLPDW